MRTLLFFALLAAIPAAAQNSITVYFNFNSTELSTATRKALDEFASSHYLRSLGIFGHTDQMGTKQYNDSLSLNRARVVRDYLSQRGASSKSFSIIRGLGTARLISDQLDETSRQLNRRVVITNNYKATVIDSIMAASQSNLYHPSPSSSSSNPIPVSEAVERVKDNNNGVVARPIVKQQRGEKLIEDIQDKSTKAGENIVLKNINFYAGSHSFLAEATPALEDLLNAMQKIKTLQIEIQGHVCCQDGESDAIDNATGEMTLSVTRAKAVYDYLIENGIEKSRLSYKGLAHQFPLVAEQTEADRILNRRVEIKIIKK